MTSTLEPDAGSSPRAPAFWTVFASLVAGDVVTKLLAERHLLLHTPHEIAGGWLRLTLTYNTGAAMNLSVGGASRVVFTIVALGMLLVIFQMYRRTPRRDVGQAIALALIAAGAVGNVIDRLRSTRGVVDFIDVGVGDWRFWTFNVADMGVTTGAVLLALLLILRPEPSAPAA